ncbi:MAG TPA: ParB/Srx family N-terminal domain-containing protein [Acidimicrobiia bacterium]
MKIETVKVESLTLDPENARKHSTKNLEAIAGSLNTFGQRRPLVVWDNIVIAGNGTLEAAKSLGWTSIEITRCPPDWTHEQARAYALADNRTAELAEWDSEILASQLVELDAVGYEISDYGFEALTPPTDTDWDGALDALGGDRSPHQQMTFTLHDDQVTVVQQALQVARDMGEFVDTGNENGNGNALSRVCEIFLGDRV